MDGPSVSSRKSTAGNGVPGHAGRCTRSSRNRDGPLPDNGGIGEVVAAGRAKGECRHRVHVGTFGGHLARCADAAPVEGGPARLDNRLAGGAVGDGDGKVFRGVRERNPAVCDGCFFPAPGKSEKPAVGMGAMALGNASPGFASAGFHFHGKRESGSEVFGERLGSGNLVGHRRAAAAPPRVRARTATHFIPYAKKCYEAEAKMGLLAPLGIEPEQADLFFPVGEMQRQRTAAFLREEGIEQDHPLVLISPGSGWSGKNWPPERFRAVAEWSERERGAQVAWIGSPAEAHLVGENPPGKCWFGRFSVPELAAVMERATLWLGNDSGPMHLAAAVGCPTLSLWGPTEPAKWAPRGKRHRHLRKMERCQGCEYWNPEKTCFKQTHACMEAIRVDDVCEALSEMLSPPVP